MNEFEIAEDGVVCDPSEFDRCGDCYDYDYLNEDGLCYPCRSAVA